MLDVVATIGLHASASTWLFNIARELMIATVGEDQVMGLYAETVETIPDGTGRSLVIKSHHGSADLDRWLSRIGAPTLLSVRDPRDAAISMAKRFSTPLSVTVDWLMLDCLRMQSLAAAGHPIFRYEDRFFEDSTAASRVAAALGLAPDPAILDRIGSTYQIDAVRRFTRTLDELPPQRVSRSDLTVFDVITQLHSTHIGDARSGKWRALAPATQARLTDRFGFFLNAFDYAGR